MSFEEEKAVSVNSHLPFPNPTTSYWQSPPSRLADFRSTASLPSKTNIIVIGSGITGASIAYKFLQRYPWLNIVMLEARQASSGATGRNGGHCRSGGYLRFAKHCAMYGKQEAIKLARFEEQNCRDVYRLIMEENIDCDFRELETVDLFFDQKQWEAAVLAVQMRAEALPEHEKGGLPGRVLHTSAQAREKFKAPKAVGAITYKAATLSAYKLTCGILELALRRGLNLQTNTPATLISPVERPNGHPNNESIVTTDRGSIIADYAVILATNAYTSYLYPPLHQTIIPTRGQISAERPGSVFSGTRIPSFSYGFFSKDSLEYMMCRQPGSIGAGDVIIGGGRGQAPLEENSGVFADTIIHPAVSKYLREAPVRHFGPGNWGEDSQNGRVMQEWTGIMGYTADLMPLIGQSKSHPGLWVCAGFNGHGMALANRSAEALVRLTFHEPELDDWFPKLFQLSRIE